MSSAWKSAQRGQRGGPRGSVKAVLVASAARYDPWNDRRMWHATVSLTMSDEGLQLLRAIVKRHKASIGAVVREALRRAGPGMLNEPIRKKRSKDRMPSLRRTT